MIDPSFSEENNKGLVSIIIPAYNAEKWINRSVDSALRQTYRKIEIIIIENGSTDNTTDIVNKYRDKKICLFHSVKGVSNARNVGIENAHGEFITFLDADDWFSDDAINRMVQAVEDNADIVTARYFGDKPFEKYYKKKYDAESIDYFLKCLEIPTKRCTVTGNLYRTEFIRKNSISFDPKLSHSEDSVFFISLLKKMPTVIDLEVPVYHVYINPESTTRSCINVEAFCNSVNKVYSILQDCDSQIINGGYIFALNQILVILVHSGKKGKEQFDYIKEICNIFEFKQAIINADISNIMCSKRIIFKSLQNGMYMPLFIATSIRSISNIIRVWKDNNA